MIKCMMHDAGLRGAVQENICAMTLVAHWRSDHLLQQAFPRY